MFQQKLMISALAEVCMPGMFSFGWNHSGHVAIACNPEIFSLGKIVC